MHVVCIGRLDGRVPNIKVSRRSSAPPSRVIVGLGIYPSLTVVFESPSELTERGAWCDDQRVMDALIASNLGFIRVVSRNGCLPGRKKRLRFTESGEILSRQPGGR